MQTVTIEVINQAFNGKHSISVIHSLTEFKRACDSSHIDECAAVWLFRDFMNGPALDAVEARSTRCRMTKKGMREQSRPMPRWLNSY